MIENVYFDMDGTIIDSFPGVSTGLVHAMKEFGYEVPDVDTLHKCIGPPFSYSLPNILHIKDEDYDEFVKCYRKIYTEELMLECDVYDGVKECLTELKNRGYSITLCSSKPEAACRQILEYHKMTNLFTEIGGASADGRINTKLDVIEECFRRSPWQKREETVLVGDTKYDAEGAREAGIRCIGILWGMGTKEELLAEGAICTLETPKDVVDYISKR